LKPDLDLLFNVIKEVREENKRNDSDKNPLTVSPKDLERYVLEWFNEDKNKPRPTVQPTSDKKVKPKHAKKTIEPKDQTATNYIKRFYINNAFHGIDTITKEQMNNFADAGNKCIEFFEQHKSKFNSYMGLHSPLEIAKLLCESIKSQVDDSMYQDWTKVTPGWFNSAKAFQRLMRYMDHQAMLTDNAITYQTYGVQEDYEERERKEQEEEAEFESELESNW